MEKLNCKSLMIGDWVRIKDSIDPNDAYWLHDDNHPGQAIRVEEILSNGVNPDWYGGEINDYIPEDAIEPIPLIPEILEKNGFECRGGLWNLSGDDVGLLQGSFSFQAFAYYADPRYCFCEIAYVHELQHALRLCGIEKEIKI